jgi:FKBP12-rapamycin complex-associated protein
LKLTFDLLLQFIHDPLINWRLNIRESPERPPFSTERRQSITSAMNLEHGVQPSNFSRHRRPSILDGGILDVQEGIPPEAREAQNARAVQVLARVKEKLTGRDFKPTEELNVSDQVDKLLAQATSVENICQHWIGWCSFW